MYKIIYADPPWAYRNKTIEGNASQHYHCMDTMEIASVNVKSLADNNSALFLWATMPCLPDALDVMRIWGFQYKTVAFTWVKTNKDNTPFFGTGFYTRANPELCLLGTRGSMASEVKSHHVEQLLVAHRGIHSAKPKIVYKHIEQLFGDVPRIELFARNTVEGWDRLDGDIRQLGTIRIVSHHVKCDACGFEYDITVQESEPWLCPECGVAENG